MTALSLNILQTRSPRDAGGIPIDGVPPLEAGRTVPQGFADALGEASMPVMEGGADGEGKAANPCEPAPGSVTVTDPEAANGKTLPPLRPGLAAPETPLPDPDPVMENSRAGAKDAKPEELPVMESEADAAEGTAETAQAIVAPVLAQQILAPAGVTAGVGSVAGGVESSGGQAPGARTVSLAPAIGSAPGVAASGGGDGAAASTGQDASGANTGRRAEPDARLAARASAQGNAASAPAEPSRQGEEAGHKGIALQVRAAERPAAASEAGQSMQAASTLTATPTGAGALAGLPGAALPGAAPLGSGSAAGPQPHFPELAALVDRIAAARDSAGSASATIALAHKELGNLSLTFETTGRTLDVEVAAQDSDTQRSLAAAIAADRPQLRGSEAQAPGQSHPQAGQQGSPGASAQGGEGTARQSAEAGDGRSDRREPGREGRQQPGGGSAGATPSGPKSDGAIYA
ncbi:hypothetical protein [Alteriqipengyuania sp. 357]